MCSLVSSGPSCWRPPTRPPHDVDPGRLFEASTGSYTITKVAELEGGVSGFLRDDEAEPVASRGRRLGRCSPSTRRPKSRSSAVGMRRVDRCGFLARPAEVPQLVAKLGHCPKTPSFGGCWRFFLATIRVADEIAAALQHVFRDLQVRRIVLGVACSGMWLGLNASKSVVI